MGVLSNRICKEDVQPGDHIYSWRTAYIYAHHGIYVGDGMVIHFTRAAGQETGTGTFLDRILLSSFPSHTGNTCAICGDQSRLQGVIKSCIDCFLAGGNLYLFQYGVSPAVFINARGGTCTCAESDPVDVVLHRANFLLNNGFGTYDIFKNNCEDFAIYCKTGLVDFMASRVGRSGQLTSLTAAFNTVDIVASSVASISTLASFFSLASSSRWFLMAMTNPCLIPVAGSLYCMQRYRSDVGVRRGMFKIPVELLAEFWRP